MSNETLDNLQFTSAGPTNYNQNFIPRNPMEALQQYQQNPQAFEEQIKRMNPQGYQKALDIRNGANPKQEVLKMAQAQGVPPHILRMFGLM